mgnify:CR=1 FL=1
MTPSQRATLTKQLLKRHNATGSKYSGLTITIPLTDDYSVVYHSGGPRRSHKGFKFMEYDEAIGFITYSRRDEHYMLKQLARCSKKVTREAFHDAMREHPPLMEWILFNGF